MAPTIFLHVGMNKTGSTAIHRALRSAHGELARHGLLYPSSETSHWILNAFARGGLEAKQPLKGTGFSSVEDQRNTIKAALSAFEAEIEAFEGDTVLFSTEILRHADADGIGRLKDWLARFTDDVRLIVYVREPVAHAVSLAQQRLRRAVTTLDRIDAAPPVESARPVIEASAAVLGRERTLVRVYDREQLVGGRSETDILAVVGYRGDPAGIEPVSARESLSMPGAYLADLANRLGLDPSETTAARRDVPGPKFALTAAGRDKVLAQTAEDRAWLESEWSVAFPPPPATVREDLGPLVLPAEAVKAVADAFEAGRGAADAGRGTRRARRGAVVAAGNGKAAETPAADAETRRAKRAARREMRRALRGGGRADRGDGPGSQAG